MRNDENTLAPMTLDQIRALATVLATDLKVVAAGLGKTPAGAAMGGGSRHRGLTEELRHRFIDVRASLYQRGIYDPILVRFDTATGSQASLGELADQLSAIAASLQI